MKPNTYNLVKLTENYLSLPAKAKRNGRVNLFEEKPVNGQPTISVGGKVGENPNAYMGAFNPPVDNTNNPNQSQFNPNDPFWQTELGQTIKQIWNYMVSNWTNADAWPMPPATYSYMNSPGELHGFLMARMSSLYPNVGIPPLTNF
jgi:hypothetical protein